MNKRWMVILAAAIMVAGVLTVFSQAPAPAGEDKNASFEKLKTLVGEWEGTAGDGSVAQVSYKLVSSGSVLQETIRTSHDTDMVTNYYVDGKRIVLTHFCAAGNQPRMHAAGLSPDGKRLAFSFLDVTNLASPTTGHMRALEVTFVDASHFTQQWTWLENGKDEKKELFKLTRKRA